MIDALIFSWPY